MQKFVSDRLVLVLQQQYFFTERLQLIFFYVTQVIVIDPTSYVVFKAYS